LLDLFHYYKEDKIRMIYVRDKEDKIRMIEVLVKEDKIRTTWYFRRQWYICGPPAWGLDEVLTTPLRNKEMLRITHKVRCFLWR